MVDRQETPRKTPGPEGGAKNGDGANNLEMRLKVIPDHRKPSPYAHPAWWVVALGWLAYVRWLHLLPGVPMAMVHLELIARYAGTALVALLPMLWGMWRDRLSPDPLNFRQPTSASLLLVTVLAAWLFKVNFDAISEMLDLHEAYLLRRGG